MYLGRIRAEHNPNSMPYWSGLVTFMQRKNKAGIITVAGIALFLVSIILILPIVEYYLLSLVLMFIGVIMIGIGSAILKGFDRSLDEPQTKCYYCTGSGTLSDGTTCPRCGGTGLGRSDDDQ
jgi:hypothetical protein